MKAFPGTLFSDWDCEDSADVQAALILLDEEEAMQARVREREEKKAKEEAKKNKRKGKRR